VVQTILHVLEQTRADTAQPDVQVTNWAESRATHNATDCLPDFRIPGDQPLGCILAMKYHRILIAYASDYLRLRQSTAQIVLLLHMRTGGPAVEGSGWFVAAIARAARGRGTRPAAVVRTE
jgi:hypothetical protein